MMPLYDYQEEAVHKLRAAFKSKRSGLLIAPTASGKTVMFSYILKMVVEKGNRAVVVVHRDFLMKQTGNKLKSFGVDHGMVIQGETDPENPIQVCMIQSLRSRTLRHPPDLIVVDEAHLVKGASYLKFIDNYPNAKVLLVTATPEPILTTAYQKYVEFIVEAETIYGLMNRINPATGMPFLVKPVYYQAKFDRSKLVKGTNGEFTEESSKGLVIPIMGDILNSYATQSKDKKFVLFAPSVDTSKDFCALFNGAGIKTGHIDGSTKSGKNGNFDERDQIFEDLKNGDIQGFSNCRVATEGFDEPTIGCIIDVQPNAQIHTWLQKAGRAMRAAPGKENFHLRDHVGNVETHGFIEEPRIYEIKEKKKSKGKFDDIKPREDCPKCNKPLSNPLACNDTIGCGWIHVPQSKQIDIIDAEMEAIVYRVESVKTRLGVKSAHELLNEMRKRYMELQGKLTKAGKPYKPAFVWWKMAELYGEESMIAITPTKLLPWAVRIASV